MNIWKKIQQLLNDDHKLYLLTVIESVGSAPGRRGFKMIVANDGILHGSIGGGLMEFNMVEVAKLLLKKGIVQQHTSTQVHRADSKSGSGMICSGSQTIAFNHLTKDDLMLVSACIQSPQTIEFSNKGIKLIDTNFGEYCKIKFSDVWCYSEHVNSKPIAHIFGAGHVSVPTSQLLTQLGFKVYLYDNRDNINTFKDNKHTLDKVLIDYQDISKLANISNQDYVLLMTHKFTEDKLILSQLLNIKLKYLGVLGSDNKIQVMFNALLKDGFSKSQLDTVNAPIGLDINSQTTEEISVSILAKIIQVKNSTLISTKTSVIPEKAGIHLE